jgi:arsenate reductase
MSELGVDISEYRSKSTDEFRGVDFDVVITLCDNAAKNCPAWLGKGKQVHIGFPDPAAAKGSEAERQERFRETRAGIRERVLGFLEEWEGADAPPTFVI